MTIIIVEDEPHSRERLRDLLAQLPDLQIIGEAGDGAAAIKIIDALKPDLVFLDIAMPGLSGLEVLVHLQHRPQVIFVTAYDQYAVKAFEENAVDYLLKPTSLERLGQAVEKARQRRRIVDDQLLGLLKHLTSAKSYRRTFAVKLGDEILLVPESEVYYFKADGDYNYLYTRERRFLYDATLKELETVLDPELFTRIHKSVIVAIRHIRRLQKLFLGDYVAVLDNSDHTALRVGRTHLVSLRSRLGF